MNRERLEELALMLDEIDRHPLPEVKFNMAVWYQKNNGSAVCACHTAACALGHAALHPPFIEQGLKLHPSFGGLEFNSNWGYDAGAAFFDILVNESEYLFSTDSYPCSSTYITPAMVAARVRELLGRSTIPFVADQIKEWLHSNGRNPDYNSDDYIAPAELRKLLEAAYNAGKASI